MARGGRWNMLAGGVQDATRHVERALADVGGANSPELRGAAVTLARSIRRVLSTRGGGTASAPGQPPRRQKGQLARSVAQGVVGTGRRVAVLRFTGTLLEEGVNSVAGAVKRRTSRTGRRHQAGRVRRTLRIAPRPFMELGLERVREQLTREFGVTVSERVEARL